MKLGIIGTGRMAQAIVSSLLRTGNIDASQITGIDPFPASKESFLKLSPDAPLGWKMSISELIEHQEVLLLAVKPQNMDEVLPQLEAISEDCLIISIAAGIKLSRLEAIFQKGQPIIRVMPNTPMLIGDGVVAWCGNTHTQPHHHEQVASLFESVARVYQVEETEMDAVTALSGSGPAFFYRIIEYLEQAAIEAGLHPDRARDFSTGTAIGAARMLQETGLPPEELVTQVRSKGGTTAAGLEVLEQGEVASLLSQTIHAAARRSQELG